MKKIVSIATAAVLTLSLAACGGSSSSGTTAGASETKAASGEQIVITFANGQAEDHAVNQAFKKFVETIEEKSGGTMTGTMYPNAQLGGDSAVLQSVKDGSVTMTWLTGASTVSLVPELAVFDIPFLFKDVDTANKVLDDEEFMSWLSAAYEKGGFHNAGFDATGYRWLTTKGNPVSKMEDVKGMKLRTMENSYHIAFWKALGTTPTSLPNSEIYAALQQGTVDGQENSVENSYRRKIQEVQDCFINTKHIVYTSTWPVNLAFYQGLNDEQRAIFDEAMAACVEEANKAIMDNEETILSDLEGQGITVIRDLGEEENARWAEVAAPAAEELIRKDIGDEAVEKLLSTVEKY